MRIRINLTRVEGLLLIPISGYIQILFFGKTFNFGCNLNYMPTYQSDELIEIENGECISSDLRLLIFNTPESSPMEVQITNSITIHFSLQLVNEYEIYDYSYSYNGSEWRKMTYSNTFITTSGNMFFLTIPSNVLPLPQVCQEFPITSREIVIPGHLSSHSPHHNHHHEYPNILPSRFPGPYSPRKPSTLRQVSTFYPEIPRKQSQTVAGLSNMENIDEININKLEESLMFINEQVSKCLGYFMVYEDIRSRIVQSQNMFEGQYMEHILEIFDFHMIPSCIPSKMIRMATVLGDRKVSFWRERILNKLKISRPIINVGLIIQYSKIKKLSSPD